MKLTWLVSLALVAGCSKTNANYCANAPDHNCAEQTDAPQTGSDGPMGCQQQSDCTSSDLPVCDTGSHLCVACDSTHLTACPSATPICDTTGETCHTCVTHSECGSPGACLPDGTCGTDTNVAYVSSTGTNTGSCTAAAACATITYALTQSKPYIKVSGQITDQPTIQSAVTILADATGKVVPSTFGPVITVKGTAAVTIHDLTVTGGGMATGDGIYVPSGESPTLVLDRVRLDQNTGHGVNAQGGSLVIARSTVIANTAGGILAAVSTFDISNTFIVRNGNSSTGHGGADIAATNAGGSRFAFNTVVDNMVPNQSLIAGGVTCDVSGFTAPNNVIAQNYVNNMTSPGNANNVGLCTYPTSVIETTITDLHFVSPENAPYDYHLGSGSVAIDQAATVMNIDIDVDGDSRPQGSGKDQGADEYK